MKNRPDGLAVVLGAVLAGGRSRRMGRDKALLEVRGQPLVHRPLAALRSVVEEVVVIAPRRRPYARLGVTVVPDLRPNLGPVGGLHAALRHAGGRPVFLLACDMPFVAAELIRFLLYPPAGQGWSSIDENWRRHALARVPVDHGRTEPLCGVYGGGCLPTVDRALNRGCRSAHDLLDELMSERVEIDAAASWYHPNLFTNVNSPEDYAELESLVGAAAPSDG